MARLSRTWAATQRPVPNSRRNVIVMPVIITLLLHLSDKCAIVLSAGATAIGKVVAGSMSASLLLVDCRATLKSSANLRSTPR